MDRGEPVIPLEWSVSAEKSTSEYYMHTDDTPIHYNPLHGCIESERNLPSLPVTQHMKHTGMRRQ